MAEEQLFAKIQAINHALVLNRMKIEAEQKNYVKKFGIDNGISFLKQQQQQQFC